MPCTWRKVDLMKKDFEKIGTIIESSSDELVETMSGMISIKSVSPLSGGEGEKERADYLEKKLASWGIGAVRYDYTDESGAVRSNIVAKYGNCNRTLWIVAHIDTVAEGEIGLWKTDPYSAVVKDGRIYGRGTNDNGQEVIAGMFALKALMESGAELKYNIGLALVADEEIGSRYGIQKLLDEPVFDGSGLFIVPDSGDRKGDKIEVAEKGILWLRITVRGTQVHASTPEKGDNAYRHSIGFIGRIDKYLHERYNASDDIFDPNMSTFEPTKHEKNVDSVNIVPGVDISYIDCRVLPRYDLDEILGNLKRIASEEFKGIDISVDPILKEEAAPPTDVNAEIVKELSSALKEVRGIDAKAIGIGGGTCAAFFRKKGFSAAVWSTEDDVAHRANEYAVISNIIDDAKIFAYICLKD